MTSKARAAYKLLRKKTGLRYVMDVIPLDATLIKGSHGSIAVAPDYHPVLITNGNVGQDNPDATEVYSIIWELLNS